MSAHRGEESPSRRSNAMLLLMLCKVSLSRSSSQCLEYCQQMYKSDRKSLLIIMYWLIYIFSGLCTEVIISESLTGLFWETRSNAFNICSETSIQKLEKKITTYLKCFIVALNVLHKIRERFHKRYSRVVVSVKFIQYYLLHLSGLELKFERQE